MYPLPSFFYFISLVFSLFFSDVEYISQALQALADQYFLLRKRLLS